MKLFRHAKFFGLMSCLLAIAPLAMRAQTFTYNPNLPVPDYPTNGVVTSLTTSGLSGTIASITVTLNLVGTGAGAVNGDYYAELVNSNSTDFAVLLNRVGLSSSDTNGTGYLDNGFNVTFSDSADYDVHFYQNYSPSLNGNGQLTGTWQPDGENISPTSDPSAFDNALNQQTAMLGSFIGDNPNDTWTLFLQDLGGPGGTGEVVSWSIDIATIVPEPTEISLLAAGFIFLGAR